MSFQQTQNQEYLDICEERLRSSNNLIWTDQASDMIHKTSYTKINDIGCNVGHLYKTLASDGGNPDKLTHLEYCGMDNEPCYLEIAKKYFPSGKFVLHDVEKDPIPLAQISVCSATLEHLETPLETLQSILSSTKNRMILRTFLGETSKFHWRMKKNATLPYIIHQFSFNVILEIMESKGFRTEIIRDKATDSMPKYIDTDIVRTQYFIVGRKKQ